MRRLPVLIHDDGSFFVDEIYNCNCFDGFKMLPDKSVDYVLTSPPYNRRRNDKYLFFNDDKVDYFSFLDAIVSESIRVSKKHVFLNVAATYYNAADVYRLFGKYADSIRLDIIWHKSNPLPSPGLQVTNAYEHFIVFGEDNVKATHTYTQNFVETSVNNNHFKEHKAVMCYEVAEFIVQSFTTENSLVLDPCMGIGTTALACRRNTRNYMGFEIVPEYCAMAEKRISEDGLSHIQYLF